MESDHTLCGTRRFGAGFANGLRHRIGGSNVVGIEKQIGEEKTTKMEKEIYGIVITRH